MQTKIIIADDLPEMRLIFKELLRTYNVDLTLVSDGVHVIEALENNHYDLLITDIEMEDMNGFEVIDYVRNSNDVRLRKMPVAAISGYSDDKELYFEHGFDEVLMKPIDKYQFIKLINRFCDNLVG